MTAELKIEDIVVGEGWKTASTWIPRSSAKDFYQLQKNTSQSIKNSITFLTGYALNSRYL